MRGSAFHWSSSSRSRLAPLRQSLLSASFSASVTMASFWTARLGRALRPLGLARLALGGDHRPEGVQAAGERGQIAHGVRLDDLVTDGLHRLGRLLRGEHRGVDPLLQQAHLEREGGVPLGEELQRFVRRALGVLAHRAFAVDRLDEDRPVLGDPTPLLARHRSSSSLVRCCSTIPC